MKSYKSPPHKLVRFFLESRDKWKEKYLSLKKDNKYLQNKISFLNGSKTRWKEKSLYLDKELKKKAKELELRTTELKKGEIKWKKKRKQLKKTVSLELTDFQSGLFGHCYSAPQIHLCIELVLKKALSFRGVTGALELCYDSLGFDFSVPSYSSVRLWIQRLGYYKLNREKEIEEDWVWILDHTIQLEATKCLLILGIRLSKLPPTGEALSLEDVEPLALIPVEKSNGDIVYEQLKQTSMKTGIPREILSDAGTDIKKGVELFCRKHPETNHIYDITHKSACVLKQSLEKNDEWLLFCKNIAKTRKSIQQTPISFVLPPAFKTKARYMNLGENIAWGNRILAWKEHEIGKLPPKEQKKLRDKLCWIDDFKKPINDWREMMQVVSAVENFVRNEGLFPQCETVLEKLPDMKVSGEKAQDVKEKLIEFVKIQSLKVHIHERLVASSEVIESTFGKFKRIEKYQSKNGFTSMLLAIPAMLSKTTEKIVSKALKEVKTKTVILWGNDNLGKTTNSKKLTFRKVADNLLKNTTAQLSGNKSGINANT